MEIGGDKNEIVPSASIPLLVAVFIIFFCCYYCFSATRSLEKWWWWWSYSAGYNIVLLFLYKESTMVRSVLSCDFNTTWTG